MGTIATSIADSRAGNMRTVVVSGTRRITSTGTIFDREPEISASRSRSRARVVTSRRVDFWRKPRIRIRPISIVSRTEGIVVILRWVRDDLGSKRHGDDSKRERPEEERARGREA